MTIDTNTIGKPELRKGADTPLVVGAGAAGDGGHLH